MNKFKWTENRTAMLWSS